MVWQAHRHPAALWGDQMTAAAAAAGPLLPQRGALMSSVVLPLCSAVTSMVAVSEGMSRSVVNSMHQVLNGLTQKR